MRHLLCVLIFSFLVSPFITEAQDAMQSGPQTSTIAKSREYEKKRAEWFYRGRVVRGQSAAELRRRAYQAKLQMRAQRAGEVGSPRGNGGSG